MKIYILILLGVISGCAQAKSDRSEFERGVAVGCSQNMEFKGNNKNDADLFCGCLANIVVSDMSAEEFRMASSIPNDEKILVTVMIRNMAPVKQCEKLAPNAKY